MTTLKTIHVANYQKVIAKLLKLSLDLAFSLKIVKLTSSFLNESFFAPRRHLRLEIQNKRFDHAANKSVWKNREITRKK